jgi:RecJ-like exonuclease
MRQKIKCAECNGKGEVVIDEGEWYSHLETCETCGGSGELDDPDDDGSELEVARGYVSPYLLRPLRTIEQAEKDMRK